MDPPLSSDLPAWADRPKTIPLPKWCPAVPAASGTDATSGQSFTTTGLSRQDGQVLDSGLLLQKLTRDVDLLCLRVNAWEFRIKHIRELTTKLHKRMPSLKLQAEANANKSHFRDLANRCSSVLPVVCTTHTKTMISLEDEVHAIHSQIQQLVDDQSDQALESEDSVALEVGQQALQAAALPVGPADSDVRPPRLAGRGSRPAPAESSHPSSSSGGRGSQPAPAERYPLSSSSGGRGSRPAPAQGSPPSSSSGGGVGRPAAAGRAAPSCASGSADHGPADANIIMTRWGQTTFCDEAAPTLRHPTPSAEAAPTLRYLPPPVDEACWAQTANPSGM